MKYHNLVGHKILVYGFNYWCINWPETHSITSNRGCEGMSLIEIYKHQICDIPGPLFGVECIYEKFGNGMKDFVYPVTELERMDRVPIGHEISENHYQIY
jgi:hypothetical protein